MPPAIQLETSRTRGNPSELRGVFVIVDDDPHISRALGMWLEMLGLRAAHHLSAESLLQALQQVGEIPTLLHEVDSPVSSPLAGAVLDLNLPGSNGFELASALRRLAPELPIVIITALREEERARYGQPPAGIQCLKKPFDLAELEDALFPLLH